MSYLGVGVSPHGHGTDLKVVDRKVRLAELILRALVLVLALAALLLLATDSQVQEIFTIQKKANFTDMKALVSLVVVNGVAAAYSLVQLMACLMLAAIGAALQSALLAKYAEPELQWMKLTV